MLALLLTALTTAGAKPTQIKLCHTCIQGILNQDTRVRLGLFLAEETERIGLVRSLEFTVSDLVGNGVVTINGQVLDDSTWVRNERDNVVHRVPVPANEELLVEVSSADGEGLQLEIDLAGSTVAP